MTKAALVKTHDNTFQVARKCKAEIEFRVPDQAGYRPMVILLNAPGLKEISFLENGMR